MLVRWPLHPVMAAATPEEPASWFQTSPDPPSACRVRLAPARWPCRHREETSPDSGDREGDRVSGAARGRAAAYPEKDRAQRNPTRPRKARVADLTPWRAAESLRIPARAAPAREPPVNRPCP